MSNIQAYHSKLWFAGENKNWKLADFEINEIKEGLDNIKKYQSERAESQSISMISSPLESVAGAIKEKNLIRFEQNYHTLTNTCNDCHRATNHEFIQIEAPNTQTFSNQVFKLNP